MTDTTNIDEKTKNVTCSSWPRFHGDHGLGNGTLQLYDNISFTHYYDAKSTTCNIAEIRKVYTTFYLYYASYAFPAICAIGLIGNGLNLAVFSCKRMRTKTNCFLSAMALSDVLFFLTMYPTTLDAYASLRHSEDFKAFYFATIMPLMGLANWFSAASIWFAVAVTIERTVAIQFPLRRRHRFATTSRLSVVVLIVFFLTFALNTHYYYAARIDKQRVCNRCGVYSYALYSHTPRSCPLCHAAAATSVLLCSLLVVLVPLVVSTVLNIVLLRYLRQHQMDIDDFCSKNTSMTKGGLRQIRAPTRIRINDFRVTVMVTAITACYIMCNALSAVLFVWRWTETLQGIETTALKAYMWDVSNALVALGRMLNFLLYCMSSRSFRKQLLDLIIYRRAVNRKRRRARGVEGEAVPMERKKVTSDDAAIVEKGDSTPNRQSNSQPSATLPSDPPTSPNAFDSWLLRTWAV